MAKNFDFGAVNTKVKYLEGCFLKEEQIQRLLSSKDILEAISCLKTDSPYGEALKEVNSEELQTRKLERLLMENYMERFSSLMHFLNIQYKELLRVQFIKYEVEDIKTLLRGKNRGIGNESLTGYLNFKCSLSNIDYESLLKCADVKQIVEALKGTIYYKHIYMLSNHLSTNGLFQLEMALDLVYFSVLRKITRRLCDADREIIKKLNGTYADLLNLQWIFRGIKFYGLKPEILFNYTIYDGWRFRKEDIKALCYSRSLSEFHMEVDKTPYKEVFSSCSSQEYLLQREILSYMKRVYIKYKVEFKKDISVVLSYLELAFIEVRDIIAIMEGVRYKLEREEIMKFITAIE